MFWNREHCHRAIIRNVQSWILCQKSWPIATKSVRRTGRRGILRELSLISIMRLLVVHREISIASKSHHSFLCLTARILPAMTSGFLKSWKKSEEDNFVSAIEARREVNDIFMTIRFESFVLLFKKLKSRLLEYIDWGGQFAWTDQLSSFDLVLARRDCQFDDRPVSAIFWTW
jgi:hypothetical protein